MFLNPYLISTAEDNVPIVAFRRPSPPSKGLVGYNPEVCRTGTSLASSTVTDTFNSKPPPRHHQTPPQQTPHTTRLASMGHLVTVATCSLNQWALDVLFAIPPAPTIFADRHSGMAMLPASSRAFRKPRRLEPDSVLAPCVFRTWLLKQRNTDTRQGAGDHRLWMPRSFPRARCAHTPLIAWTI
jgi:hypothetical protein